MEKLKYVVTGTGRCGTVFIAKWLTSLGVKCGHEAIFDAQGMDAAVRRLRHPDAAKPSHISSIFGNDWLPAGDFVADSSYMAAPYLPHETLRDVSVIHLVRDPLLVMNSFVKDLGYFRETSPSNDFEKFIYHFMPILTQEMDPLTRFAYFYVRWNRLIERNSENRKYVRIRIEDFDPYTLLDFMGIGVTSLRLSMAFQDRRANSMRTDAPMIPFHDIPHSPVKKLLLRTGAEYGYEHPYVPFM